MIMTVRGAIPAADLGYTLSHEHLLCDLWRFVRSYDAILNDESIAIQELAEYKAAGGATVVDVTSGGLGRNPAALRRISDATGLHIVMGAGWYREPFYDRSIWERTTNAIAVSISTQVFVPEESVFFAQM